MSLQISHKSSHLSGSIRLNGSKSISNRALIIRALCERKGRHSNEQLPPDLAKAGNTSYPFEINNLSNAKDSQQLAHALHHPISLVDAGAGGTTFRFLTAWLCTQPGHQTLTGSTRMQQRPIAPLVEALQQIGADIQYLGQDGFPPIRIGEFALERMAATGSHISIRADISSQFISALLLIAPTLPGGLTLHLEGPLVSASYIRMTLRLMGHFGVSTTFDNATIRVPPQQYVPKDLIVEADWSAASYYYGLAAFAKTADVTLEGLQANSIQGDSILAEMMPVLGVQTHFGTNHIRLTKPATVQLPQQFNYDFTDCPDLAQTLAVICAGLGVPGRFSGLSTLRIKETDRIAALEAELSKVNVSISEATQDGFTISGKAAIQDPVFDTYDDHRMAMSLAMLGMLRQVTIRTPEVVEKSYPSFWEDLECIGVAVDGGR